MKRALTFPKRFKKTAMVILLGLLLVPLSGINRQMYGDVRLKEYSQYRDRLERQIKSAEESAERSEWDQVVYTGREALFAEWERDAERQINEQILEEGEKGEESRSEYEAEKEEARIKWEREADLQIEKARGEWLARSQDIEYTDFDREKLEEALTAARAQADSVEDREGKVAAWDETVNEALGIVNGSWEAAFLYSHL